MSFVKLDCNMLNSSIWPDKDARDVFITMLLMASLWDTTNPIEAKEIRSLSPSGFVVPPGWYGWVGAAAPGIAHRCGIDPKKCIDAIERLASPDPDSRSSRFDGRRIARIDGGYVILNYDEYRKRDTTASERSKRYREKIATERRSVTPDSPDCQSDDRERRSDTHTESRGQREEYRSADETAAQSPEPASRASDRKPSKPREPDPIWDCVVDRWYGGGKSLTKSQRGAANAVVRDLKELGATPEEIAVRADRIAAAWSESSCTAHSLVKHWHQFATDPKPRTQGAANGIHARDARRAEIASRNCPDPRGERPIPFITID